jgi:hypothetical protein
LNQRSSHTFDTSPVNPTNQSKKRYNPFETIQIGFTRPSVTRPGPQLVEILNGLMGIITARPPYVCLFAGRKSFRREGHAKKEDQHTQEWG